MGSAGICAAPRIAPSDHVAQFLMFRQGADRGGDRAAGWDGIGASEDHDAVAEVFGAVDERAG